MRYEIGYVKEHIGVLVRMDHKSEEFRNRYHFICGMLEAYEREGKQAQENIQWTWQTFSYAVAMKLNLAPYFALRDRAESIPRALEAYPNDLYKIDFQSLVEYPDKSFFWVLREMGTHLWFTDPISEAFTPGRARKGAMESVHNVISTFSNVLYLGYWDAKEVKMYDLPIKDWEAEFNETFPG